MAHMVHMLGSQIIKVGVIALAAMTTAWALAAVQDSNAHIAPKTDVIEQEVERINREIDTAIVRRDRTALEHMLTDDFTVIHASGVIDSGVGYLEQVSAGNALQRQNTEDYAEFEVVCHIYDSRTALRRSRVRLRYKQQNRELKYFNARGILGQAGGGGTAGTNTKVTDLAL
jgi:hypothetical protein